MPDETATATSDTARKFALGGRVVNRRDPRDAWRSRASSLGARMLWLYCGTMSMVSPEEQWIEMPDDWVDPPQFPYGCIAAGTSDAALRDKAAHDAANPPISSRVGGYEEDLFRWRKRHRDPLLARLAAEAKP